jgi:hypothetical protein
MAIAAYVTSQLAAVQSKTPVRMVLEVEKSGTGKLLYLLYSIDEPGHAHDSRGVCSPTVQNRNVNFIVDMGAGSFEGKLSAVRISIAGTWFDFKPLPLVFSRVGKSGTRLYALPTGEHCPKGLICLGSAHAEPKKARYRFFCECWPSHERSPVAARSRSEPVGQIAGREMEIVRIKRALQRAGIER